MTDQQPLSFYAKSFNWTALAVLAILPVIAVKSASTGMRVTWTCVLLLFCVLGIIVHLQTKDDPELQYKGAYFYNRKPVTLGIMLSVLLVAEILAIIATYATSETPLLWQASLLISHFGEAVFPLIPKYATQMEPPLPPEVLYKVQAIMTLFLAAGGVSAILFVPYVVLMPRKDVLYLEKAQIRVRGNRWLSRHPLILVPFAILAGFAAFFGCGQFDPDPAYLTRKKCLLEAACYTQDDLRLIATGYLTIFGSYGFWLALLIFVIRASEADPD